MKNLILLLFLVGLGNCVFQKNDTPKKIKVIEKSYNMYLDTTN